MKKIFLAIIIPAILVIGLSTHHCNAKPSVEKPLCKILVSENGESSFFQAACNTLDKTFATFKSTISNFVEKARSPWVRLLFTFLLGILMSLTPCIYPMVPITVGILQTTASKSLARNFFLALAYTTGIATTFAVLGLLAAMGSTQFGALLGNVWFVLFLVLFLGYMALTMLGIVELHVPRFMQSSNETTVNGSLISAFIFGAISGTVASPCLSPGLILLLGIVATIGSKLSGFLLLFVFGIGLGIPLLIIGTFSNALQLMPRAGFWMVEVKKLFGIMLLSMCFYYLVPIVPLTVLLILIGCTMIAVGMFYLTESRNKLISKWVRGYRIIIGFLLITGAFLPFLNAYRSYLQSAEKNMFLETRESYLEARTFAQEEHHLLIIDFGADWCSSCKAIAKNIIGNKKVRSLLRNITFVNIDGTDTSNSVNNALHKKFDVKGYPTLLLIDPTDERVIARWGSEVAAMTPEEFSELVRSYA
ncbi:MAG: thioredoxin family protein [Candidatus Babeliaceae bacterium]|nr:thioredoxin family protein [Candidatus Babeliaceae bacterium]